MKDVARRPLTQDQHMVNALRVWLGKRPLYLYESPEGPYGSYISREALRQKADPNCHRCLGSGYYDKWVLDDRCPCTGLPSLEGIRGGKKGRGLAPAQRRALIGAGT